MCKTEFKATMVSGADSEQSSPEHNNTQRTVKRVDKSLDIYLNIDFVEFYRRI